LEDRPLGLSRGGGGSGESLFGFNKVVACLFRGSRMCDRSCFAAGEDPVRTDALEAEDGFSSPKLLFVLVEGH
jgi:hypothetical protein